MFEKIDHIGIATADLEKIRLLFRDAFGMEPAQAETLETIGVKTALYPVGETALEYVEPTSSDSAISKFLENRGEGIHHICFQVDDIESSLETLARGGIELIDKKPRLGANNRRIAFLHPKSTHGVLIELAEKIAPGNDKTSV